MIIKLHFRIRNLLWFIPLAIFSQCAPDSSSKEKENPVVVSFTCETRIDEATGSPFSEAYLLVGEQKVKVADIGACDPFEAASFADYQIPPNALAACGGWWAGAGDYLYVVREENTLKVFQGWQEEGQEDEGFHYKEVYSLKLKS